MRVLGFREGCLFGCRMSLLDLKSLGRPSYLNRGHVSVCRERAVIINHRRFISKGCLIGILDIKLDLLDLTLSLDPLFSQDSLHSNEVLRVSQIGFGKACRVLGFHAFD